MDTGYDTAIIGAGITGTALFYVLTNYSNIKNIILIEKYREPSLVNSNPGNNSQTLHCGDIETNYSRERVLVVNEAAKMLERYVVREGKDLYNKTYRMVLGVGEDESRILEERFNLIKDIFPKLEFVGEERLAELEPDVLRGRKPGVRLSALINEDGYAVDFKKLSESFIRKGVEKKDGGAHVLLDTKVRRIIQNGNGYRILIPGAEIIAKTVVVAAGAHSLKFARMLGHGKEYTVFPTVGGFYTLPNALRNKVYTVQMKKLPYAAIHGDPDVVNPSITRFGPTTKIMPFLERWNFRTLMDFLRVFSISPDTIKSICAILNDREILRFLGRNLLYALPFIGKRAFMKTVRKILPEADIKKLKFASGVGGLRPQIVDIRAKKLVMNEAKIMGRNIIFNMTPSPGASVCLKSAEEDAKAIITFLGAGYEFDSATFQKDFRE